MPTRRKNHCIYCDKFVNNGTHFCCEEHKRLYWQPLEPKPLEPRTCKCGRSFVPKNDSQIYCSKACRANAIPVPNRAVYRGNLPTGTTGAISELIICAELAKMGFDIFRAISPTCFCDLIAVKNSKTFRIEARTGTRGLKGQLSFPSNAHGDIDLFVVYVPEENAIFYFNPDLTEANI